jgi:replicative DNA helicase
LGISRVPPQDGLRAIELKAVLDVAHQKTGRDVNLMVIDYLGLLDTYDLDKTTYGQVTKMAKGLKVLAKDRDLSLIVLCQVNRMAGDDLTSPLNIHAARDTGAIEESADFLLGLFRPDYHGEDKVMAVQVLKNRKGNVGEFRYVFNKDNLRIYSETS